MPIGGHAIEKISAEGCADRDTCDKIEQGSYATKKMESVHAGEKIKKGTIRIGREIEALGGKLAPGEVLAAEKCETEKQANREP